MSKLDELMSAAADEMRTSLKKTRIALDHSLTKGEANEEAFRLFLRDHLPKSLSVTRGQIVDSTGMVSKQIDVIVYDTNRTPILFITSEKDHQLVPSEGVVAVIEVKTRLEKDDVKNVIENMDSVKRLDKSAYFSEPAVDFSMYGKQLSIFPTLYFVFTYESSHLGTLAQAFNDQQKTHDYDKRVDAFCALDKGVLLNYDPYADNVDALASSRTSFVGYNSKNALCLFYLLISKYMLQAVFGPIKLKDYIPESFRY